MGSVRKLTPAGALTKFGFSSGLHADSIHSILSTMLTLRRRMSASATLVGVRSHCVLATSFLCAHPGGQGFVVKYKHQNRAGVEYRPDARPLHSLLSDKDGRYPG